MDQPVLQVTVGHSDGSTVQTSNTNKPLFSFFTIFNFSKITCAQYSMFLIFRSVQKNFVED